MACWKMRSLRLEYLAFVFRRLAWESPLVLPGRGVLSPSNSLDKFFLVSPQVCAYFLHGNPVDSWRSLVCLYSLKSSVGLPFSVSPQRVPAVHCPFPSISGGKNGALSPTLHVPRYLFASSYLCFLYPMFFPPFPVVLKTPVDSVLHLSTTTTSADFCNVQHYLSIRVIPFRTFRTDLPRYHTSLSLHLSATFTIRDSVWLLGFDLFSDLTLTHGLM